MYVAVLYNYSDGHFQDELSGYLNFVKGSSNSVATVTEAFICVDCT